MELREKLASGFLGSFFGNCLAPALAVEFFFEEGVPIASGRFGQFKGGAPFRGNPHGFLEGGAVVGVDLDAFFAPAHGNVELFSARGGEAVGGLGDKDILNTLALGGVGCRAVAVGPVAVVLVEDGPGGEAEVAFGGEAFDFAKVAVAMAAAVPAETIAGQADAVAVGEGNGFVGEDLELFGFGQVEGPGCFVLGLHEDIALGSDFGYGQTLPAFDAFAVLVVLDEETGGIVFGLALLGGFPMKVAVAGEGVFVAEPLRLEEFLADRGGDLAAFGAGRGHDKGSGLAQAQGEVVLGELAVAFFAIRDFAKGSHGVKFEEGVGEIALAQVGHRFAVGFGFLAANAGDFGGAQSGELLEGTEGIAAGYGGVLSGVAGEEDAGVGSGGLEEGVEIAGAEEAGFVDPENLAFGLLLEFGIGEVVGGSFGVGESGLAQGVAGGVGGGSEGKDGMAV